MLVLLTIHSWLRWVIILVMAAAIVKFAVGLMRKSEYGKMDNGLMMGLSGLMDLQATLGIVQLIAGWRVFSSAGFPRQQIEHAVVMVIAAAVGHLAARWKDKPAPIRYRNNLIVIAGLIALVVAGVSLLAGQRWVFRF